MKKRFHTQQFVIVESQGFWGRPAATLLLIIFSFILMVASAWDNQAANQAGMRLSSLTAPAVNAIAAPFKAMGATLSSVSGLSGMQSEIEALRVENKELRNWKKTAIYLETENKSLRDLLNLQVSPQANFVSGRVITDPGNSYVRSLLVLAGQNHGVEKSQPVLSAEGLIGRIIAVDKTIARVLLLTDINSRVPVIVEGSGLHAIMAGDNSASPVLDHLPPGTELEDGAMIMTSGHGGVFPPGLPVGRTVTNKDGQASVALFTDFKNLQHARILKSEKIKHFN